MNALFVNCRSETTVPDWWKGRMIRLGGLAASAETRLVAGMPSWLAMMIDKNEFDLNPPGGSSGSFQTNFRTNAELLKILDDGVGAARTALQKTNDDHLMKPWRLLVAGKTVAEHPRHIMMRDSINHLAHHRGQLTVYLRLNDLPVPAVYGPSADDQRFS